MAGTLAHPRRTWPLNRQARPSGTGAGWGIRAGPCGCMPPPSPSCEDHDGSVPDTYHELLGLPGVGSYTAAAVAAFAFGRRETVVDTNIRRVHARLVSGTALPAPALTAAEMRLAAACCRPTTAPPSAGTPRSWNWAPWCARPGRPNALTARSGTPVRGCAAGEPPPSYVPKGQAWHGTDRQVRGAVMAVLRLADAPVPADMFQQPPADLGFAPEGIGVPLAALHRLNSAPEQLERALAGLLADGLAEIARRRLPASRLKGRSAAGWHTSGDRATRGNHENHSLHRVGAVRVWPPSSPSSGRCGRPGASRSRWPAGPRSRPP